MTETRNFYIRAFVYTHRAVLICGRTFLIWFTRSDATRRITFPPSCAASVGREGRRETAMLLVARSYFICDSRRLVTHAASGVIVRFTRGSPPMSLRQSHVEACPESYSP